MGYTKNTWQKCLIFIPIRNLDSLLQFASVLHLRAFFEQRECSEYMPKKLAWSPANC